MTDPRLDDQLLAAVRNLPTGSGVIFRHYQLEFEQRYKLFAKVRRICRQRGHLLFLAGDATTAWKWHADGAHGRLGGGSRLQHSAPVHNIREISEAKRLGAAILFLSPLRATRSHPEARPLGPMRFQMLARACRPANVVALGGMSRAEAAKWPRRLVHGWAAIDAFRF